MPIPPWILESPLKAGIATMQSGAQLGLGIRHADAAEREQAEAEERAGDLLRFHYAQLSQQDRMAQARLAQAGSAAEALRQYRGSEMLHRLAQEAHNRNNEALRNKRLDQFQAKQDATDLLTRSVNEQTGKFFGELQDGVNPASLLSKYPLASHDPSVRRLLADAAVTDRMNARFANKASQGLTPSARATELLRVAAPATLSTANPSDPFYSQRTNALAHAMSILMPPTPEEQFKQKVRMAMDAGQPLPPASPSLLSQPQSAEQRVRMRSKDGTIGSVPASQLDQAIKEGYSVLNAD